MNTSDLLEQLLRAGQGSQSRQGSGGVAQDGLGGLGGLLGGLLGGRAGGSTGGIPQGRSTGGSNFATLASLGMMAFQAYQSWQRSQAAAPQPALQTVDQLSGPEAEDHSHAILRALIAAAKADGRIDKQEEQLIYAEIKRQTSDPQLQQWLDEEVSKPLDVAEVARSAQNPAMAAEMYLASVMLVDDQQDDERAYLDELAGALQIDPTLQVHLEQQAKATT
ncbi:MAG: tellurite resistance TerB family protein [Candidatus Pseudomonas phytovorans]|uniref:Tellurite resistance TerB family protein n=1 Tax=Candidatus Pseudomonas phytovorans TaxID=3121377 RepID=A0AAJ6B9Q6_9PSED|nr:tellurite resistance TerB family protein [Pseudomonas sp.]WEK28923.1 MAG: tellurite resistance TerB family protein [Pseudomonas sp.]